MLFIFILEMMDIIDFNENYNYGIKSIKKTNLESHARYKQDYTKWEQENI